MQKKIIALAVAALASSAAMAQSNVTVYGIADASFENTRASGGTQNATLTADQAGNAASTNAVSKQRVASNSSYIGFKGVEDLGNGLKAVFQFENELDISGANSATNANARGTGLGNRDTYVGVAGGFGTVLAGFVSSLHRSTAASFDLMPGAAGTGSSLNIIGRINTGSVLNPRLANGGTAHTFGASGVAGAVANNVGVIGRHNAIAYVSPNFSGFSGAIAYVANETADNNNIAAGASQRDPKAWNFKAAYDNGPLNLAYSYLTISDFGVLSAGGTTAGFTAAGLSGDEKHKAHLFGAKYTFAGATTVSFMYDRTSSDLGGIGGVANALTGQVGNNLTIKRNSFYLAAKHQFGKNSITGAYASAGKNKTNVNAAAGTSVEDGSNAKMFTLRYGYDFSKRTQAYAQYSTIRNGANASYDFGVSQSAIGSGAGFGTLTAGADVTAFGAGIRHSF